MASDSDVETVWEDSPLSPCVWTHTATQTVEKQRQSLRQTMLLKEPQEAVTPVAELLLSPASQLNVLAQISELADVQSKEATRHPQVPWPTQQRTHVWAHAMESTKRRNSLPVVPSKPSRSKRPKAQKQPIRSQADRLAQDMLNWETCSEGELFALDADAEDQWVYEDISDSDFDMN